MNKFAKLNFGLAAVLALSFVAFAEELVQRESLESDERPIVEVQVNGKTFRAPVNEDIAVSKARKEFDKETINSLFGKLAEMVDLIVVQKAGHFRVARTALSIVPQAMKNSKKLKQLKKNDTTPHMAHGYANKMGDLVVDIATARTDERIDAQEAKARADNMILAVQKMTQESSTGLYLDWTKFTVDGISLTDYVAPVLQWFRDNGYGMELRLFDGLATVIKGLGGNKKQ